MFQPMSTPYCRGLSSVHSTSHICCLLQRDSSVRCLFNIIVNLGWKIKIRMVIAKAANYKCKMEETVRHRCKTERVSSVGQTHDRRRDSWPTIMSAMIVHRS